MACADAAGTQGQGEGGQGVSGQRESREATTSQGYRKETASHRPTPNRQGEARIKARDGDFLVQHHSCRADQRACTE